MRIVVCGDDGVGKSTLITTLVKDRYIPNIEDVLPLIFIPVDNFAVTVVDTSPQLSKQDQLVSQIRQANVIWLIYSDHYTYERITLFWMPFLRSMGVNLPVILCENKYDLRRTPIGNESDDEDVVSIMQEFKEIEGFIRCSAKLRENVSEAFYLCVRAVTHPLAPLFDSKEGVFKRETLNALRRVFFICDQGQTGYFTDLELIELQLSCFNSSVEAQELEEIKRILIERQELDKKEYYVPGKGLSIDGFISLCRFYVEQGRHETVWGILRYFHYTNSLSLDEKFLHPEIEIPALSHVELSPDGYRFLVDLFKLFDKDRDGGLCQQELDTLFMPTPGLPRLWQECKFPASTVGNDNGDVTLQGWLAQWSMFVFLDPREALAYLAFLGYTTRLGSKITRAAVTITKQARLRNPKSKIYRSSVVRDRHVFKCLVLGTRGSGKSRLFSSFLGHTAPFSTSPGVVVNSVEMPGGKQCYLILEEMDHDAFKDMQQMEECDVLCCVYDSSDPDSFEHLIRSREANPKVDEIPVVFAALKADLDRQQQRCRVQPDEYAESLGVSLPLHVSVEWPSSLNALFVNLVEAAMRPGSATPFANYPLEDESIVPTLVAASAVVGGAFILYMAFRKSL